jgi:hypothetical protein
MRAARDVSKGLVDRNPLHQWGEVAEHADRGIAQPLVLPEMAIDENQVGAKLARSPSRHAAADAERLSLVGCGEHDAAADRDRLAAQGRIEQLLDRCVEGIEVRVEDGGRSLHPEPLG